MSENAVIPFTFVRLKTLVDGGLRIEVDVPEIHQPLAFALFKTGADGAFVRLNERGAASGPTGKNGTSSMVEACDDPRPNNTLKEFIKICPEPPGAKPKRHVSETTLKAYELCRNNDFQHYAWLKTPIKQEYVSPINEARDYIVTKCGVNHRSEIDKSAESAKRFGEILEDFSRWKSKC